MKNKDKGIIEAFDFVLSKITDNKVISTLEYQIYVNYPQYCKVLNDRREFKLAIEKVAKDEYFPKWPDLLNNIAPAPGTSRFRIETIKDPFTEKDAEVLYYYYAQVYLDNKWQYIICSRSNHGGTNKLEDTTVESMYTTDKLTSFGHNCCKSEGFAELVIKTFKEKNKEELEKDFIYTQYKYVE